MFFPTKKTKQQQNEEPPAASTVMIDEPRSSDVLCGQDKTYSLHHGNKVFRQVIESRIEMYKHAGSKNAKMAITKEIVQIMHTVHNARFIKRLTTGRWQEITDKVARDKISHALRFAANNNNNNNNNNNSTPAPASAAAVAATKTKKPQPKRKTTRKTHRRTISDDSTSTSTSAMSLATASSSSSDTMQQLFQNQQRILGELSREMECDEEVARLTRQANDNNEDALPDTLRSEDLDAIMSAPVVYSIRSEDIMAVMGEPMMSMSQRSADLRSFHTEDFDDEPNTLRSEDLEAILSEPFEFDQEWNSIRSMIR